MKDHWREINNKKAEMAWSAKIDQVFRAIEMCLASGLWESSLILLYSTMDAMAWLDRPVEAPDVTSTHFISWCDRYLLDPVDEGVTSTDIYAARCGMLHSHTAESRRFREGKVIKLFYSRKTEAGELNLDQLKFLPVWPMWVDMDVIIPRMKAAVEKFRTAVEAVPEKRNLVRDRILDSYLVEVSVTGVPTAN